MLKVIGCERLLQHLVGETIAIPASKKSGKTGSPGRVSIKLVAKVMGVSIANDEMTMGCVCAVNMAGFKIPGDISIIGFDDTRQAAIVDPPLTTIGQSAAPRGE